MLGVSVGLGDIGWVVQPAFIDAAFVAELVGDMDRRELAGAFRDAAVGVGQVRSVHPMIRGDRICWLSMASSPSEQRVLALFERLRQQLNESLMLGLHDLECHYAIYDQGRRYARHVDRSDQGAQRVVSVVLYLNADWAAGDGGELCMVTPAGNVIIEPRAGTLVSFLSDRFPHEVLVSQATRRSVTGWFRRRPVFPVS